jgi:plasmid stabilization system protein ParE
LTRPYSIRVTKRAAAEARQLATWWLQNRPAAPDAVRLELERAFMLLSVSPQIGALAKNASLSGVRRIYLVKIQHHLYYRLKNNSVEVLALWHTSRGHGPSI